MEFGEFIVGLLMGIITNLIAWWILFHQIVPNIEFSNGISKLLKASTIDDKTKYDYRIKIGNIGRRSVIDNEISARLRIKGIGRFKRTNWQIFFIPLALDGETHYKIPKILPMKMFKKRSHVLRLHINGNPFEFDRPMFPKYIRDKAKKRLLSLEDLLKLGNKAEIAIQLFGYDEFSGTRKLFVSKSYSIEDIYEKPFNSSNLDIDFTNKENNLVHEEENE